MANVEYKIEEATPQRKNKMVVFVALLAVVVLVAGGTLAYLTTTTNTESNVFTAGNIKAVLTEPLWTMPEEEGDRDGTSGEEIAANMLPGTIAPKNPFITNTSTNNVSENVGMVVIFEKPTGVTDGVVDGWEPMTDVEVRNLLIGVHLDKRTDTTSPPATGGITTNNSWAEINVNGQGYIQQAGKRVYLYNSAIAKDASTDPLFGRAGIVSGAGSEDWTADDGMDAVTLDNFMTWLYAPLSPDDTTTAGGLAGHYRITLQGAAVQAHSDSTATIESILELLGYTKS